MLLPITKHTDTLIEQTKTKPQETLEFQQNRQTEIFSLSPRINSVEGERILLALTSFEATNFVYKISDGSSSFSFSTWRHWYPQVGGEIFDKLIKSLELRSEEDIDLCLKEIEKRGTWIKLQNRGYFLAGFEYFESEILAELRRVKFNDLEDMVYRMELTYDEALG